MSRQRRSTSLFVPMALLLVAIVCLATFLATWLVNRLPAWAEKKYGPPTAALSDFQRLYLSALVLLQSDDLTLPKDPSAETRLFQISLGESVPSIANRLQAEGFISSSQAFRNYLIYAGLDTTLQAGEYTLSPQMTPVEIAHALQDATRGVVTFHILAGWRLEEIAAALPTSGLNLKPQVFLNAASRAPANSPLSKELPEGASLEGFLFPDAYRLKRNLTVDELITAALERFQTRVDDELRQGFQKQGLTLFQAVTLASQVQREAMVADEMPIIASVFYNRLNAGMKLDSDPTVQYALGYQAESRTWWKNPLSLEDLKVDSPYNTYLYRGLPPGPIANPGLPALRAVAFPAQTNYLYFRAECDQSGRHRFARTFQEHLNNACP